MKRILIILWWLLFIITSELKSQNNLIPNAGFENGFAGHQPQCEYAVNANLPIKIKLR